MTHLPRYTSEVGIQLIAEFEGLKLERYRDGQGYGPLVMDTLFYLKRSTRYAK